MHRSLIFVTSLTLSALFAAQTVHAQNLPTEARDFIKGNTSTDLGCLIFGDDPPSDMLRRNALVWQESSGDWRAVVVNKDVSSATPAPAPCWISSSRCAVYDGPLPDFGLECAPNSPGLIAPTAGLVKELLVLDPVLFGKDTLSDAEHLKNLADGILSEDTHVTAISGAEVYYSFTAEGEIRARFQFGSNRIDIQRLRHTPSDFDSSALQTFAERLDVSELATAGPNGAATTTGLVISDGRCFQLISAGDFKLRLSTAEGILSLGTVPSTALETQAALDDLLQSLLGTNFAVGRALEYEVDQDSRVFLSATGEEVSCPG